MRDVEARLARLQHGPRFLLLLTGLGCIEARCFSHCTLDAGCCPACLVCSREGTTEHEAALCLVNNGHSGPYLVQGELVVRDGVYVSEDNAAMRLTGVYVPATGRLLAVAEPAAPVLAVPLDAGEGAESLDYRWVSKDQGWLSIWAGT